MRDCCRVKSSRTLQHTVDDAMTRAILARMVRQIRWIIASGIAVEISQFRFQVISVIGAQMTAVCADSPVDLAARYQPLTLRCVDIMSLTSLVRPKFQNFGLLLYSHCWQSIVNTGIVVGVHRRSAYHQADHLLLAALFISKSFAKIIVN